MKYIWWQSYREWVFKGQWNWQKWPPGVQRKKDQQTGSPCSHLPSLFIENFRHFPSSTLTKLFPEPPVVAFRRPKSIRIHWSELRYLDLHRRSASVNHVVTSVASAVFNCNMHKCSIARRQERSIRSLQCQLQNT